MSDDKTKTYLLTLARESINSYFNKRILKDIIKKETMPEAVLKKGACFVTLTKHKNLRGCIGSLEPYRPLFEDVISNSINSAFRDTRFAQVNKTEMADIRIEISILSPRLEVQYENFEDLKKKIIPGIHGVYLTFSYYSATFLPQVWEHLPSHEQFFGNLSQKAGLSPDFIFHNKPKIEIYTVENFEEE